jgi:hypothetical protein
MKKILIAVIFASLLVITLTLSFASAEFLACFEKGQVENYCASVPETPYHHPDETCIQNMGCEECMWAYYPEVDGGCYVHGSWPKCNDITPRVCSTSGGNVTIDSQPPILTLNNPAEGAIYNSRKILLDLEVSESSKIYYMDLDTGRGRWMPVCYDCFEYSKERTFAEGENNLQFKATDVMGLDSYTNLSFFIDSQKPRILKTEPRGKFSNGDFYVEFKEENPEHLYITYGNAGKGFNIYEFNVNEECQLDDNNGKHSCKTKIDLSNYNGEQIIYWANLTDMAENIVSSRKPTTIIVDTTPPYLTQFTYSINNQYVTFKANIAEENFEGASYSYKDSFNRLKLGKLCTRLMGGEVCEKKLSFRTGHYDLSIQFRDKGGNSVEELVSFDII